jgi:hypothetical protein
MPSLNCSAWCSVFYPFMGWIIPADAASLLAVFGWLGEVCRELDKWEAVLVGSFLEPPFGWNEAGRGKAVLISYVVIPHQESHCFHALYLFSTLLVLPVHTNHFYSSHFLLWTFPQTLSGSSVYKPSVCDSSSCGLIPFFFSGVI